jgi:acetyl-CoA carboxylase carboxyltransferase component
MLRRRTQGKRTARENVHHLVDEGSFIEYGALTVAGQRRRRSFEDLKVNTPADGMVSGIGSINGHLFPEEKSRCVVCAYDYTVLAGTQGIFNHMKKDRVSRLQVQ